MLSDATSDSFFVYFVYLDMGTRYRSALIDEQCFFVTSTFVDWCEVLFDEKAYSIIAENLTFYSTKYEAGIVAFVLMPNHIHFVIVFPKQTRLSDFMRDFKKYTSSQLRRHIEKEKPEWVSRFVHEQRTQKFQLWMNRFDDVWIGNRELLETKLNYIHENPVKKGFCTLPAEYKWSSAGFYEDGTVPVVPVTHYLDVI